MSRRFSASIMMIYILLLISSSFLISLYATTPITISKSEIKLSKTGEYIVTEPVYINSDNDFKKYSFIKGSGIKEDPYIIEKHINQSIKSDC